ncbi:MAG TPA: serine hydrolase [Nitriliruptorales bacterium]
MPWPTAAPGDVGIDGTVLEAVDERQTVGHPWLDSLVVVRRGQLVWERHYNGTTHETQHELKSATKSFFSLLVGAAIERGVVGLDTRLAEHLDRYVDRDGVDPRKGEITLGACLAMRSGLAWVDNDERAMRWLVSDDPVAFSFSEEQPVAAPPGTTTTYSSADSQLAAACLASASGRSLSELAQQWLLEPIGAGPWQWPSRPHEVLGRDLELAGSELRLQATDHARLGELVLRGGRWGGHQIVSEDWIRRATTRQEGLDLAAGRAVSTREQHPIHAVKDGYGLHWWLGRFRGHEAILATGYGGQYCFVVPALELVVVHHARLFYEPELIEMLDDGMRRGVVDQLGRQVGPGGVEWSAQIGRRMQDLRAGKPIADGFVGGLVLMNDVIVPAVDDA